MTSLAILSVVLVTIASSAAAVIVPSNCSAINDPGVRNLTMRLPVTNVPSAETTITCLKFLFPNDTVYDIIAMEPAIDNAEVVDHMELWACNEDPKVNTVTHSCGVGFVCPNYIGYWSVGLSGQCVNNQYGIRIGPGGFQYVVVKVHATNLQMKSNLTDSSGWIIYYTSNLRPHPGGNLVGGQYYLDIPPGLQEVPAVGSCVSDCTKRFPSSIYLTSAILYMQLLGASGSITLYRNGTQIQVLQFVSNYDYYMPTRIEFENPIEVKQGDEIRTTCVYNSTSRNTTTYFGQATSAENCLSILSYYPLMNDFLYCAQWKSTIDVCPNVDDILSPLCDAQKFIQYSQNLTSGPCSQNCEMASCGEIMNEIYATGCLYHEDIRSYLRTWIPSFVPVLGNCEFANPMPPTCSTTTQASQSSRTSPYSAGGQSSRTIPYNAGILLGVMALYYTSF